MNTINIYGDKMEEHLKKLINEYTYTYSEEGGSLHIEVFLERDNEINWTAPIEPELIYEVIEEKGYMDDDDEELIVWGEERHIHPIIALMMTIYKMDELKYQLIALNIAYASQDSILRMNSSWNIDILA